MEKQPMKLEIQWDNGKTEICEVVKKYTNGNYQLNRKSRKRMELVSAYSEEYLRHPYKGIDGEQWVFVDVYLKDSKGYETARVRRVKD